MIPSGPKASTRCTNCLPRCRNPRRSRPVARCRRSISTSSTVRPDRTASTVIRASEPANPNASGNTRRRAAGDSARWPEIGSRASRPQVARISARAVRLTIPNPPPCRSENAAIARSASLSSSGPRSPVRSASQSSSGPGAAARSAIVRACPLPRRGRRRTRAPAASARAAVPSRDPSSATITSAAGNLFLSVATVAAITRSSSRAATRIATGSATHLGR